MNRMNHLRAETHTRARGLAHGVRQTATMIVRGCALLCFRTGVQRGFDGAVVGGQMWIFLKLQSRESANGLEESDANGDEC